MLDQKFVVVMPDQEGCDFIGESQFHHWRPASPRNGWGKVGRFEAFESFEGEAKRAVIDPHASRK